MLIARTDPDAAEARTASPTSGSTCEPPGVEVRPLVNIAGQLEFNEVFLTDVRVPDLLRISPVGEGWAAAMTTLGAERHALSGVRKKRKSSDEILGGKPLAEVVAMAPTGDARCRRRVIALAAAHTADRLLQLTAQRARAAAAAGRSPGPEGSISKIAKAVDQPAPPGTRARSPRRRLPRRGRPATTTQRSGSPSSCAHGRTASRAARRRSNATSSASGSSDSPANPIRSRARPGARCHEAERRRRRAVLAQVAEFVGNSAIGLHIHDDAATRRLLRPSTSPTGRRAPTR